MSAGDWAERTAAQLRMLEALLFAAPEPLAEADLAARLPEGAVVPYLLKELEAHYRHRGINLVSVGGRWQFRTAEDLAGLLRLERREPRRLSRAAVETLAIIAYHQPVTRAEVEEIRGVALSRGTLDTLLEASWIKPRGRRDTPGRPLQWGTTEAFLDHFGLADIKELPGLEDLKAMGLLEKRSGLTSIAMQQDDLLEEPEEAAEQLDFLPDDTVEDD